MKKVRILIATILFAGANLFVSAQPTVLSYTGAVQTYVVPSCVTSIIVDASGAQGGGPNGGLGGRAIATVPVIPGATIYIYVGGQPTVRPGAGSGGFNGGGAIITMPCGGGTNDGWGGGGASDIRLTPALTDRMVVGGGGGGTGWSSGAGGAGGGLIGSDGAPSWIVGTQGFGGTQSAGGAGGFYSGNGQSAPSGTLGQGGDANPVNTYCTGGGGGGGYYGGGGGYVSAGAGGSSYISYPGSTSTSTTSGFRSGNGIVSITPVNGVPSTGAINGSNSICASASGNYSIVAMPGATSYTWSVPSGSTINSGQGTISINMTAGSTSGTIAVTATYTCGTSAPTNFTLTVNPAPNVGITLSPSSSVCPGTSVTLNGTGASSYSWSGGVTDGVAFIPVSSATYTVTGTTAGCTGTATQTITVNALPTVIANSSVSAICMGSSVTLFGSGASTYSWTGGATDGVPFSPTVTDTYTVTGTDANGCVNTATTSVVVNGISIVTANSTSQAICMGSTVTLTGSGSNTYVWSVGVTDGIPFSPTSTGTYTVTGTDSNGCQDTDVISVVVNGISIVTANATSTEICTGSNVTLTGSGASTYVWTGGVSDGISFVPTSTITYTVTGTDSNGCQDTDMITVTVNPLPSVVGVASASTACLSDGIISLTGGPTGGTWTGPGVSGSSFTPMTAGVGNHTLSYSFTDANGCSGTATVVITVNGCMGINQPNFENGINIFPNPNNGIFTIQAVSNLEGLQIEITDLQGRIVFASSENNVHSGFVKQISLQSESSGLYLVHIIANGVQWTEKISIQK